MQALLCSVPTPNNGTQSPSKPHPVPINHSCQEGFDTAEKRKSSPSFIRFLSLARTPCQDSLEAFVSLVTDWKRRIGRWGRSEEDAGGNALLRHAMVQLGHASVVLRQISHMRRHLLLLISWVRPSLPPLSLSALIGTKPSAPRILARMDGSTSVEHATVTVIPQLPVRQQGVPTFGTGGCSMSWVFNAVPPARPALTILYDKSSRVLPRKPNKICLPMPYDGAYINVEVIEDLRWFVDVCQASPKVQFRQDEFWHETQADMEIWTDASVARPGLCHRLRRLSLSP